MQTASLDALRAPGGSASKLRLETYRRAGDHVLEGVLHSDDGRWFPILDGVPSFLPAPLQRDLTAFAARHALPYERPNERHASAAEQARTSETFSDKWRRFRNYGLEARHQDFLLNWYCRKFGLPESRQALVDFYSTRKRVLEVGPGSGFNTRFIAENCDGEVFAMDISDAAFTTFENTRHLPNCTVIQADAMDAPLQDAYFDLVIADGVLHHTPDTEAALKAIFQKVTPGGEFFFYVYRKMGPARRFCDSHIRERFTKLTAEECYTACEGITELGRELSRLNVKVSLAKPIPILGIPAGVHDVQRLLYYNFLKCFWNDAFDYETNNMINFDWYHPHYAWQHTREEVEGWLRAMDVVDYAFHDANPNGISVLLKKKR